MQPDEEQTTDKRISIRLTDEEYDHLERLRQQLTQKLKGTPFAAHLRVTQKTVIMAALDALDTQLADDH